MRDFNELSPAENEFIVASGNKIIYTENETLGTFAFGDVQQDSSLEQQVLSKDMKQLQMNS